MFGYPINLIGKIKNVLIKKGFLWHNTLYPIVRFIDYSSNFLLLQICKVRGLDGLHRASHRVHLRRHSLAVSIPQYTISLAVFELDFILISSPAKKTYPPSQKNLNLKF